MDTGRLGILNIGRFGVSFFLTSRRFWYIFSYGLESRHNIIHVKMTRSGVDVYSSFFVYFEN